MGTSALLMGGSKSQPEALACIQILDNVDYTLSGGIVGMHYFSHMSWPVGFFVFTQLPDHLHNGLI